MNTDEIKKIILSELKRIAPDTNPEKLLPDENIRQALDIDSFDALQFIIALDKKLGINIPEEDYGKTTTLKSLMDYVENKMKD